MKNTKIKFGKEVFRFLNEKLNDTDKLYEILDRAVYHAEQNVSLQAIKMKMQYQEMVVLASLKVAEIIKELFGDVEFTYTSFGGGTCKVAETAYCELV